MIIIIKKERKKEKNFAVLLYGWLIDNQSNMRIQFLNLLIIIIFHKFGISFMGNICSSHKKKNDLKMKLENHPQQQIISDLQQQSQNSQLRECQHHSPCNELSNVILSDLIMKNSQKEENIQSNHRSPDSIQQFEIQFKSSQLIKNESSTKNIFDRRVLKMIKCHSCGRQIKQKYSIQTLQNIF
ncbi:hypothetical protein pb186bvf_012289 [Paramecium bursaria]